MDDENQRRTTLPTGFGGSYDQYQGDILSLDKLLVQTASATYFMRVNGDNAGARIEDGDIVVVDRSLDPVNNDIVVAILASDSTDSEFAIRRILFKSNAVELYRDREKHNDDAMPSETVTEGDLQIWGVVTASITQHRKTASHYD